MRPLFFGILIGLCIAMLPVIALAESAPPGLNAGAWAASAASAGASAGVSVKTAQTAAQQVAVTVNQPAPEASGGGGKTTTLRTAPDPYAPTMNATAPCRISVSAGIAVIGIGVSGGGSVEDDPCNLRETARLLDGIGQREAAARVMCNDPRAAAALGATVCPSSGDQPPSAGEYTQRQEARSHSQATQEACDQAARFDDPLLADRNGCRQ